MGTKQEKFISVYKSRTGNCLFTEQFDFWESCDWNEDLPEFFDRLNEIKDDRSFVILASSVLEYQIDRFLKEFIPNHKVLINDRTNLVTKINLIKKFYFKQKNLDFRIFISLIYGILTKKKFLNLEETMR